MEICAVSDENGNYRYIDIGIKQIMRNERENLNMKKVKRSTKI